MLTSISRIRWWLTPAAVVLGISVALTGTSPAGDDPKGHDIFDHEAHKIAKDCTRIALIADTDPHGPRGNHEFVAGPIYMVRTLNAAYPNCYATVTTYDKFPKDLSHADAVPARKLNEIIWHTIKGVDSVVPLPRGIPIGDDDD